MYYNFLLFTFHVQGCDVTHFRVTARSEVAYRSLLPTTCRCYSRLFERFCFYGCTVASVGRRREPGYVVWVSDLLGKVFLLHWGTCAVLSTTSRSSVPWTRSAPRTGSV